MKTRHSDGRLCRTDTCFGKNCKYCSIPIFDVEKHLNVLLFYISSHQIINILCPLIIVWKVMLTHLWICAAQLYLFGANIASRAKYWSLVQNIDSRPAGGVPGDEGSSEGTMTQLEGNPKNPDNLLNLLYCPRLAGCLLGEHCISWKPAAQQYSTGFGKNPANGWWVHMSMLGRVYCEPSSPPTSPLSAGRWHHCNIIESHHVCVSLCEEYIAV